LAAWFGSLVWQPGLAAWFGSLLNGGQMFPVIDSGIRTSDCTFHDESWQPEFFVNNVPSCSRGIQSNFWK
jgi:hypothetical protein